MEKELAMNTANMTALKIMQAVEQGRRLRKVK